MTEHEQPAGWYPTPDPALRDRFARYWDGTAWTDHQIEIAHAVEQPAREIAPTAPAPASAPRQPDSRPTAERPPRRLAWIPKVVIASAVVFMIAVFGFESADANGPIAYSLRNESTVVNPLVFAPELRVSTESQSQKIRMAARAQGDLSRISGISWSLDEPVTIEMIPAYPGEVGHTFIVDLRRAGANALNANWFLRIDVVATDRFFEVEINQPVTQGFVRSRSVTQRITLPRSNERMLRAALDAERERASEVRQARATCNREESAARFDAIAPILQLQTLYETSLDRRKIYGSEPISFEEFRRRINSLASDMQAHLRDAEGVAVSEPKPATGEFERLIREYSILRSAWVDFERALRTPRTGPERSFDELYPTEYGAVDRAQLEFQDLATLASAAATRVISLEVMGLCESRYPEP